MSQNIEDYTWKDIPWVDPSRPTVLSVNEGTKAVIPKLDKNGEKSGDFLVLEHDDYIRVLGSLAYLKESSDGNPSSYLKKELPEKVPESNPVVRRKAMLPAGGMEK